MKPRLALLAALSALNPALKAADQPVGVEPQIVPGTFAASDATAQPLALWLERGNAVIASTTSSSSEASAPSLFLPAQLPPARACLLLNAPEVQIASLSLRFRFARTGEASAPETIEWELAGVPLRFTGDEAGLWRVEFHTTQEGWRPLLAPEGEELGAGWHALRLEFSASAPRSWHLRWDAREAGSWVPEARPEVPLLVVGGGAHTGVWLDDVATAGAAEIAPPETGDPAAAALARITVLRQEIEDAVRDLARETGVRRQRILRRHGSGAVPRLSGSAQTRGLTVLTNLEERQTQPESSSE